MGRLNFDYFDKYAKGDTFVETGAMNGWTANLAKSYGFNKVYSVELQPDLYEQCLSNYPDDNVIKFSCGESPDFLLDLVKDFTEPVTFWLDAHRSGSDGIMPGSPKYGPCPLVEELQAIATSPCKNHVLIIDDIRLFGTHEWGYVKKDDVLNEIYKINPDYKIIYLDGDEEGNLPKDIMLVSTFI